ncbi:hypothetical protein Tco_0323751 [Tanacetum coccineum]
MSPLDRRSVTVGTLRLQLVVGEWVGGSGLTAESESSIENEQVYAKTGFAPHRIPQSEGNHNGWLSEEEEVDSDSESTASNCPHTV